MIGFLRGSLSFKKPPFLVIDVQGVGYECQSPMSTFYQLPDVGQEAFLYTHFAVREDAQVLYAFFQEQERALFRALIKISNVGPKLALAILSSIEPDLFVKSILQQDVPALTHLPGVGKKTAERLIIEMKDRLQDWDFQITQNDHSSSKLQVNRICQDAISALEALGYKPQEASRLVSFVTDPYHNTEELIRLALQRHSKGSS